MATRESTSESMRESANESANESTNESTKDAIRLPKILDLPGVHELRPRIEHASRGSSIVIDGAYLERVETAGVQLLCALVLSAEGRGVTVTWVRATTTLVNYVKLLGIGDVIGFDDGQELRPRIRMSRD
jgi:anti-anti-sigma regulatory factor